jgi:hypothetical protein
MLMLDENQEKDDDDVCGGDGNNDEVNYYGYLIFQSVFI